LISQIIKRRRCGYLKNSLKEGVLVFEVVSWQRFFNRKTRTKTKEKIVIMLIFEFDKKHTKK